jgi:hypothetical protein
VKNLLNRNESMQKQINTLETNMSILVHTNDNNKKQINKLTSDVSILVYANNNSANLIKKYEKVQTKMNNVILEQSKRLLNLEHYDRIELCIIKPFDITAIIRDHHNIWKNLNDIPSRRCKARHMDSTLSDSTQPLLYYGIFFPIASVTLPTGIWNIVNCICFEQDKFLIKKLNEIGTCTICVNPSERSNSRRKTCKLHPKFNKCCMSIIPNTIKYHDHPPEIINKYKNGLISYCEAVPLILFIHMMDATIQAIFH